MDVKDIERLIIGRYIIDRIKTPDPVILQELNFKTKKANSFDHEIVTQSLVKIEALKKIECDSIIDAQNNLFGIGFDGIESFLKFNEQMCFEEYFESLSIKRGKLCGLCPTRKCEKFFVAYPCTQKRLMPYDDALTVDEFLKEAKTMIFAFWQNKIPAICPIDFGWIYGTKRKARFDLMWRIVARSDYWKEYDLQSQQEGGVLNEQWKKVISTK